MTIDIDLSKYRGDELDRYLTGKIRKLEGTRAFKKALTSPKCGDWSPEGLVKRTFRFRSENVKVIALHAKVMSAFLRALRVYPQMEVTASFTSMYSGSYRTFDQQNDLYQMYLRGTGYKAANPCSGYHRTARALDLLPDPDGGRTHQSEAMTGVKVDGKRFYHGDVFGDPPHYSFAELG